MAAKKHPIFDTATTLGKIMLFLGVSAICGVLVAGIMVPAVALTGNTATSSIDFFDQLPDEMNVGVPAQSSKILAADGSLLATFYDQNRTEVKLANISPFMKNAVVAIEDARYYEHGGIDTQGLLRAVTSMARGGDRQGASTITQQYVNNVIIQTLEANGEKDKVKMGYDKTAGDKVREIKLAIAMEKKYSKDEILQGYLNWVYFANNNYGIESAAMYYFGVHAKDLTLPQAATLAGVVNRPSYYDPVTNPDNALSRRNMVLDRMLAQKMIDAKAHDAATKAKLVLKVTPNKKGCTTAVRGEYFCEYVTNLIANDANFGKTKADREKKLYQGGLTIKTTLDPRLQDAAQAQFEKFTPMANNPDRIGQSLVTVQPKTGKILAMAQNTKLDAPKNQWSTEYNFNVDRLDNKGQSLGGAGGFDVGSTIKPFTFAEWLNSGHKINDMVDATVRRYPVSFNWKNSCGVTTGAYDSTDPGNASPDLQNAEEGYGYTRTTARMGLVLSLNTATFATAAQMDMCNIQKMMSATGIHLGEDPNKPYNLDNSSSLIGSGEVAPVIMASAFATFASGGIHCDPIALVSITNAKGDKLPVPGANCKQTVRPEVAAGVVSVLQQVLVNGSGYKIPLPFPSGAKTGTTNSSQQTWTTGFTKGLVTTSWLGNIVDKNASSNDKLIAGTKIPYVDGATYAGVAWQSYMTQVAGGFDTSAFPAPPESMVNPIVVAPPPSTNNDKNNDKGNNKPTNNAPTPKKKD
ncbi:MAG: transglycosylase domain-containing protein [Specibacter sp.]